MYDGQSLLLPSCTASNVLYQCSSWSAWNTAIYNVCTVFVGSSLALAAVSFSKRHHKHLAFRIAPEPLAGEAKPHLPQLTQIDGGHLPLSIVPAAVEVPDPKAARQVAGPDCTYASLKPLPVPSDTDSGYNSPPSLSRNPSGFYNHSALVPTSLEDLPRGFEECKELYSSGGAQELRNIEIIELALRGIIPFHALEKTLGDCTRAVHIRRSIVSRTARTRAQGSVEYSKLPYRDYDFASVHGVCAENVIGFMPVPVGVAGPLRVDGEETFLPMATTEGTLIASTSRGCKAINAGGGVITVGVDDGMTRAPIICFDNVTLAAEAKAFIESPAGQAALCQAFDATTRFGHLLSVNAKIAGSSLYLRFKARTGEAMGMNMIGKGVQAALASLRNDLGFAHMRIMSLSGNFCTDKKATAINWIQGRGKSVVAEAIIKPEVVQSVLKCSVSSLTHLNTNKNYIGSALAGTAAGGFNAHAANIVTAMFLATGQDPAQNVESSNCITIMEKLPDGSLRASVTMPSIEVGTVGGGTGLGPQSAMLELLGVKGTSSSGGGAMALARIIAGGVLAGELSLCAALVTGELVKSHMIHNRKD